ncbi:MAG: uridine monophosphate kinase [candidate division WOR-3 bacterium]|nr:MAG: uridine monophosphate kinase [candidate division WOR-3 bacterium]
MKEEPHRITHRRVLLKLSGEHIGTEGESFDKHALDYIVEQIIAAKDLGAKIGIVVGAGNIIRGRDAGWLDKIDADTCGMVGTVINGIVLHSLLKGKGQRVRLSSALTMVGIADDFNRSSDYDFYESGGIVIFIGGTGNPLFTTDTAAALRAVQLRADVLIKGTNVAGVYSSDPKKNKRATFYRKLTYDQVIGKQLKVMDLAAFNICREAAVPIIVYDFKRHGLSDIITGKMVGTLISGGRND